MHTSALRGSDFDLTLKAQPVDHANLFGHITRHHRLGLICPAPLDGLGASALLWAATTAFYDDYRATGGEFFAYPDFFAFHLTASPASYSWLDIWPDHKNVTVAPTDLVDAITDRGVQTLVLPQGWCGTSDLHKVQYAALQRCLLGGWVYGPGGCVEDADLVIRCRNMPMMEWAQKVMATVDGPAPEWHTQVDGDRFQQTFRQLSCTDTMSKL